jgi:hypothetical protein
VTVVLRQYQILTNGHTFRVRRRHLERRWVFCRWSAWELMGTYRNVFVFEPAEYQTHEQAMEAIRKHQQDDMIELSPWSPMSVQPFTSRRSEAPDV